LGGCSVGTTDGIIYEVHCSDGMIYIPSFMGTDIGVQAILKFCLGNLRGCNIGITDERNLLSTPLR
jgi:hypothetical protein